MFSVFGMTNLDKMKESNILSVWDFFVTFVKEEWRYNITHRQTFGLFPEIQSYYNSQAMSNFIKSMANFKVSDKIIEADYIIYMPPFRAWLWIFSYATFLSFKADMGLYIELDFEMPFLFVEDLVSFAFYA